MHGPGSTYMRMRRHAPLALLGSAHQQDLSHGHIVTRDGRVVVSYTQEGLIRP